jgi:hypothetical protein
MGDSVHVWIGRIHNLREVSLSPDLLGLGLDIIIHLLLLHDSLLLLRILWKLVQTATWSTHRTPK